MFGAKIEINPPLSKQKPITSLAKMQKSFLFVRISKSL